MTVNFDTAQGMVKGVSDAILRGNFLNSQVVNLLFGAGLFIGLLFIVIFSFLMKRQVDLMSETIYDRYTPYYKRVVRIYMWVVFLLFVITGLVALKS